MSWLKLLTLAFLASALVTSCSQRSPKGVPVDAPKTPIEGGGGGGGAEAPRAPEGPQAADPTKEGEKPPVVQADPKQPGVQTPQQSEPGVQPPPRNGQGTNLDVNVVVNNQNFPLNWNGTVDQGIRGEWTFEEVAFPSK